MEPPCHKRPRFRRAEMSRNHCGAERSTGRDSLGCVSAKHGANWIKVMATGGMRTPGTDVTKAQFSVAMLQERSLTLARVVLIRVGQKPTNIGSNLGAVC
eukprot:1323829-Amphidinium_carterae.1